MVELHIILLSFDNVKKNITVFKPLFFVMSISHVR